jgi:membrane fusion protein (multidrug efflux system)
MTTPAAESEIKSPPVQRGHRHWIRHAVAVVLLLLIAGVTVWFVIEGSGHPSTSDAYIEGRIVRVSPKVAGQVIALHIDDNTEVKAGDVLLEIDPVDYQAKVDQATAGKAGAESGALQARAAVIRAEAAVGEAQAGLRVAQTQAKQKASDYKRYLATGTDGVSQQQLDEAKTAADSADALQDSADKKVAASEADLNVANTAVATADAGVKAAESQLRFAQLQLQYTKVIATESGRVTKKNVEVGNFVSAGQPLFAIVPADKWVVANFKEVQLEKMTAGQPVEVTVDAYPDLTFTAKVQSMQAGTGSRFELLPPENATGNWVKVLQRLPVKIVFDPNQKGIDKLAPGMSAEVTVDAREPGTVKSAPPLADRPGGQ